MAAHVPSLAPLRCYALVTRRGWGHPRGKYRTTITSVAPPPESVTRVVPFHSAVPVFAATRLNIAFIVPVNTAPMTS